MVPAGPDNAAEIIVQTEREVGPGWEFEVLVRRGGGEGGGGGGGGEESAHRVGLSWVDYEYWSHGAAAPERVVKAVVAVLLETRPDLPLPPRFDAATARRWVRDADERVREGIGGIG